MESENLIGFEKKLKEVLHSNSDMVKQILYLIQIMYYYLYITR